MTFPSRHAWLLSAQKLIYFIGIFVHVWCNHCSYLIKWDFLPFFSISRSLNYTRLISLAGILNVAYLLLAFMPCCCCFYYYYCCRRRVLHLLLTPLSSQCCYSYCCLFLFVSRTLNSVNCLKREKLIFFFIIHTWRRRWRRQQQWWWWWVPHHYHSPKEDCKKIWNFN